VFKFWDDLPALSVYVVDSKSDVAAIGTLSVLGTGDIFGARLVWPTAASATRAESISIGVDYKKFIDTINVTTAQTLLTHVDYLPFSVNYSLTLTDPHGSTNFAAGLTFAARGLVSTADAFGLTRYDAPNDFFYFRGSAGRTQQLPAGFSAHLQLDGQASPTPLISNEEFTVGGVSSVRGYLVAEQLGDSGLRGSFELRTPELRRPTIGLTNLYGYGFFDGAALESHDPLPGQGSHATLRSTGAGLRFTGFDHLDAGIDWAYVLAAGPRTRDHERRYNFSVRYGF
jgi:hemolysin activation/secretion protein